MDAPSLSYKNILQEYAQKSRHQLPQYRGSFEKCSKFSCTVTFLEESFQSEGGHTNKKSAEQSAAREACLKLGLCTLNDEGKAVRATPMPIVPCYQSAVDAVAASDSSTTVPVTSSTDIVEQDSNSIAREMSAMKDANAPIAGISDNDEVPLMKMLHKEKEALNKVTEVLKTTITFDKSFKTTLFELGQKHKLELPQYRTSRSMKGGFECEIAFLGRLFKSSDNVIFKSKKAAEQNASESCFNAVKDEVTALQSAVASSQLKLEGKEEVVSEPFEKDENVQFYPSILQEYLQQRCLPLPSFEFRTTIERSFEARCVVGRQEFMYSQSCKRKKDAKHYAARDALHALAGHNAEHIVAKWKTNKGKKRPLSFADAMPAQKNPHLELEREQKPAIPLATLQPKANDMPIANLLDLAVAEIWPEKRNVVVIGNKDFSIVMTCQGPDRSIYCLEKLTCVPMKPGLHIVGLQSRYVQNGGRVFLTATLCKNAVMPDEMLPVLISSGIVLIKSDAGAPQVLLKRYKFSPMFVQPAASLAQCFRQYATGRSDAYVSTESLVTKMSEWLHSEVEAIAEMSAESIRRLFHHTWKFRPQWKTIWEQELPYKLRNLRDSAKAELASRAAKGADYSEDYYRAWGLPKGNMRNRVTSTGVLIETDLDCAIRELREESGLSVDKSHVIGSPYVDVFNSDEDNPNPHRGDFTRYFIVVDAPVKDFSAVNVLNTTSETTPRRTSDVTADAFFIDATGESSTSVDVSMSPRRLPVKQRNPHLTGLSEDTYNPFDSSWDEEPSSSRDGSQSAGSSTSDELPTPRPAKHEECEWFPVDIAIERSPVLHKVSESDIFQYHLKSAQMKRNISDDNVVT